MADNIKDGPLRTLTHVAGYDSATGKGGTQAVTAFVKTTGAETVAGVKTFSSSPIVPDPTTAGQATNKGSVDTLDGANVKLTGTQTVAGAKTFSSPITGPAGLVSAPSYTLGDAVGWYRNVVNQWTFASASANQISLLASTFRMNSAVVLGWGSGDSTTAADTALQRDGGAGILGQRAGTTAQLYRLYNTWTSATNYERLSIKWASNIVQIITEAQTGTRRPLAITFTPQTVATLPTASTVGDGTVMFVNDALDPVFGKAVAGSGGVHIPVYTDGTTWFAGASAQQKEAIPVAVSDESTAITTGTSKIKFRMPYAMTVTTVKASLNVAQTSGNIVTVDINEAGSTILSTKLTIDNDETTSTTAATAAVISDAALGNDAEISVDIDQVGASADAAGLKITLIGYRT